MGGPYDGHYRRQCALVSLADGEPAEEAVAANLGWLFDGYETYALLLTLGPETHSLLDSLQYSQIPAYAGTVVAITLLGWGIGGLCGGVLADISASSAR